MQKIKVWDLAVRVFHWSLVIAVGFAFFSAYQDKMMTGYDRMHLNAGVVILILVFFRSVWALCGSTTARLMHFVKSPKAAWQYLTDPNASAETVPVGHNPAGGWSVVVMLDMLLLQCLLGLFSSDAMFFSGPFADLAGDNSGLITKLHRWNGNLLIGLLSLHVAAVLYYGIVKRDDLVRPMISGNKIVPDSQAEAAKTNKFVSPLWALLIFLLCGGLVCTIVFTLSKFL